MSQEDSITPPQGYVVWKFQHSSDSDELIPFNPQQSQYIEDLYQENDMASFKLKFEPVAQLNGGDYINNPNCPTNTKQNQQQGFDVDLGLMEYITKDQDVYEIDREEVEMGIEWYYKIVPTKTLLSQDTTTNPRDIEEIRQIPWINIEANYPKFTQGLEHLYNNALKRKAPAIPFPFNGGNQYVLNCKTYVARAIDSTDPNSILFYRRPFFEWPYATTAVTSPTPEQTTTTTPSTSPQQSNIFQGSATFLQNNNSGPKIEDGPVLYVPPIVNMTIEEAENSTEIYNKYRDVRMPDYNNLNPFDTKLFPPRKIRDFPKNKPRKATQRPARHNRDVETYIYNEMCRLPMCDATFDDITIDSLELTSFPTREEYLTQPNFLSERKFMELDTQFARDHVEGETMDCMLCMVPLWDRDEYNVYPAETIIELDCGHILHYECLKQQLSAAGKSGQCSTCRRDFVYQPGAGPVGARCTISYSSSPCDGFNNYGSITMSVSMPGGKQDHRHSNPGRPYDGDSREHIMPATPFVLKVLLKLYVKAFLLFQLFIVGYSGTRQCDGVIVYSSIHCKTSRSGGAQSHAYPDPDFPKNLLGEFQTASITLTPDEYFIE